MGTLVLVRHGQASAFAAEYDRLSPLGEEQSRRLGAHWARSGLQLDRILSGPRERQRRSAEIAGAAFGASWPGHQVVDALDEMKLDQVVRASLPSLRSHARLGPMIRSLEAGGAAALGPGLGELFRSVTAMWVRCELAPPGVESWAEFRTRVAALLARLQREEAETGRGRRVALFTSAGLISATLQIVLGLDDARTLDLLWLVKNGALSELRFDRSRMTLQSFNAIPHLDGDARLHTLF